MHLQRTKYTIPVIIYKVEQEFKPVSVLPYDLKLPMRYMTEILSSS